jgi:hypothetical protein
MTERVIDFDALKAARAEKRGDAPAVKAKVAGKLYELPRVLPASFMMQLAALQKDDLSSLREMIETVFGADNVEAVVAAWDTEDIKVFLNDVPSAISGAESGESKDSSTTLPATTPS